MIADLEYQTPVGDESESEKQGSTVNRMRIGGRRSGNRTGNAGADVESYSARQRFRTRWKPEGGVRNVDGQQIEQYRDEARRKPR